MPDPSSAPRDHDRVALVELVNRVVDKGVVLNGEITISVADIDLLFVGLRVLLCSADRMTEPVILESRASAAPAIGGGS